MLDQPLRDDLRALAWLCVTARAATSLATTAGAPELPPELLERITAREPFRAQAIADAKLWLSAPLLYGIGLAAALREPLAAARFAGWECALADVWVDVTWCRDMSCQETEGYQMRLQRVAVEQGRWRLVELLDERMRGELTSQLALFKQWRDARPR